MAENKFNIKYLFEGVPSNLEPGTIFNYENGAVITPTEFFSALGCGSDKKVYFRIKNENEAEIRAYEDNLRRNDLTRDISKYQYNPLYLKYKHFSTLEDINTIWKKMIFWNKEGYAIWFVANGGGQTDREVLRGKPIAQFIEIDDLSMNEQWDIIEAFELSPSVIIQTKKSLHCYWLIEEGDFSTWKEIQLRLIERFGADSTIKNESRAMRVPSFYHNKDIENRVLCRLMLWHPERKYKQSEFLEVLPECEKKAKKSRANRDPERTAAESSLSVHKSEEWLEEWIAQYSIPIAEKELYKTTDDREIIKYVLEEGCPFKEGHSTIESYGSAILTINSSGAIGFKCCHSHCTDKTWSDFRNVYEPDYKDRRFKEWQRKKIKLNLCKFQELLSITN